MIELAWSWEEIAITLMWKLAPSGLVLFPRDLTLPRDRVLLEERLGIASTLSFITLNEATARTHAPNARKHARLPIGSTAAGSRSPA